MKRLVATGHVDSGHQKTLMMEISFRDPIWNPKDLPREENNEK